MRNGERSMSLGCGASWPHPMTCMPVYCACACLSNPWLTQAGHQAYGASAGLIDALSQQEIMPSAHTNTAPQGDRAGPWGPGVWGRLAAALVHGIQVLPGMILPPHTWKGHGAHTMGGSTSGSSGRPGGAPSSACPGRPQGAPCMTNSSPPCSYARRV